LNVFKIEGPLQRRRPLCPAGSRTRRDAINEAMRSWMSSGNILHYIIGSVSGRIRFPVMVRDFQSVIGTETRAVPGAWAAYPTPVMPPARRGINSAGMFYPFISDASVDPLTASRRGAWPGRGDHAATLPRQQGVLHAGRSAMSCKIRRANFRVHFDLGRRDYPASARTSYLEGTAAGGLPEVDQ